MDWTGSQKFMLFALILLCFNYLSHVAVDRWTIPKSPDLAEGFDSGSGSSSSDSKEESLYSWLSDPHSIYDQFYVGVYDQLSQQMARTQAKLAILMTSWKSSLIPPSQWSVLDAGCGTGHTTVTLAKLGVGRVVGMDFSPAMIRYAEGKTTTDAKLSEKEAGAIRWRQDTLVNPSAAAGGEFTHIICFYFTLYYLHNQEEFFRHANFWTKPGGKLVVEVVNKYKFDPILESASPFVGFSLQKYSKERIHKSKVTFDKFDYEAEFVLTDPKAEFRETFRFKNGHVRRQKHMFVMPKIAEIVEMGRRAGWKYVGSQDLNPIGFEYGYLLVFEKS